MGPKIMQIHARNTLLSLAKHKYYFAPKCWQIIMSITSAEQDPKLAPKTTQIHPINILAISDKSKYKFAPKIWQIIKSIATAEHDLKLAPKSIWIHNPIISPESNINHAQRISWINDIVEPAKLKYNFAPKCWQIIRSITTAEQDLKLAPKNIKIHLITILVESAATSTKLKLKLKPTPKNT